MISEFKGESKKNSDAVSKKDAYTYRRGRQAPFHQCTDLHSKEHIRIVPRGILQTRGFHLRNCDYRVIAKKRSLCQMGRIHQLTLGHLI